jgi:hypothetical protein
MDELLTQCKFKIASRQQAWLESNRYLVDKAPEGY